MAVIYEITVKDGTYQNKQGETKNSYQRIGVVMETKAGLMMKLRSIPVIEGGWNGMAYLNPSRPKDGFPKDDGFPKENEDDIPF